MTTVTIRNFRGVENISTHPKISDTLDNRIVLTCLPTSFGSSGDVA